MTSQSKSWFGEIDWPTLGKAVGESLVCISRAVLSILKFVVRLGAYLVVACALVLATYVAFNYKLLVDYNARELAAHQQKQEQIAEMLRPDDGVGNMAAKNEILDIPKPDVIAQLHGLTLQDMDAGDLVVFVGVVMTSMIAWGVFTVIYWYPRKHKYDGMQRDNLS